MGSANQVAAQESELQSDTKIDTHLSLIANEKYEVYTDGSLDPGTRLGTYAFILVKEGEKLSETVIKVQRTDSNIMEITAAIKGLELIPEGAQVTVYSDSRVLIDMMVVDIRRWKKLNWRRRSGRTVKNRDLFMELDLLSTTRKVTWKWVRGHSGNIHNERCDQLCRQLREGVLEKA